MISASEYVAGKSYQRDAFRFLKSPEGPYPIKPFFPKTAKGRQLAQKFDRLFPEIYQSYNYSEKKLTFIQTTGR